VIFAGIGVAGLAFYLGAVALGLNTQVRPANLTENWWMVPVLVLLAVKNAVLEEVRMVGFLFTRWAQTGQTMWTIVVISAVVRDIYHLYQGWGGFAGNLLMGLVGR
jgi:membrane protease YdiL (CAAX protease family)